MREERFDVLSRVLGDGRTRRWMLGILAGVVGVGLLPTAALAKVGPEGTGRGKHRGKRRGGARAQAQAKGDNQCISPVGVDLNEFYGVSDQIVAPTPPFEGCDEVGAGERWAVPARWFVSSAPFTEPLPDGFEPAAETPLEDFNAKFEGVKYVIDPDTDHERVVSIRNSDALFVDTVRVPPGQVLISSITLGTMHPLPIGEHAVELYWVFSDLHCDGLGTVVQDNCLPAGDSLFQAAAFAVTPGHN